MGDANARQVTFSKRRPELFKKASDLCALWIVEMASTVFSPGDRPFYLGHPSVDAVLDRSEHPKMASIDAPQQDRTDRDQILEKLNRQFTKVLEQLKVGKEGPKELNDLKLLRFENFSFGEFLVFDKWLEDLEMVVDKRRMELQTIAASSSTPCPRAVDASASSQDDDESGDPLKAEAGNE